MQKLQVQGRQSSRRRQQYVSVHSFYMFICYNNYYLEIGESPVIHERTIQHGDSAILHICE